MTRLVPASVAVSAAAPSTAGTASAPGLPPRRRRPEARGHWLVFFGAWMGLLLAGALDASARELRLLTPSGYVPGLPVLARVELVDRDGKRARGVWDAEAVLETSDPALVLSTNRVFLRNGMGSTLVSWSGPTGGQGAGAVELVARWEGLVARRTLASLGPVPVIGRSGTLPGTATTWSGLVWVTNDVTVPTGHVLTIEPGTWILMAGVPSGTTAPDLRINGEIQALGTAESPVVITCADPGLRWGQIRHSGGQPSLYRHTIITLAGRAAGEGHTGTAPVLRSANARITFDSCSVTDHATPAGTPGKILQSSGSTLVMTNCLLSRARMGPEIGSTALQFLDSHIIDMRGPDDADGIYLHSQGAGQVIRLAGSVVAGGDDDGIDTLGATLSIEDCIVRGWRYPGDDSKGISVFGGEVRVTRSLLADNTIGLSGKGNTDENVRVHLDHVTILGNSYGVAVTNKSGTTPIVDYRITNSIIAAPTAVFTDYDPADIHISYTLLSQDWPGAGNQTGAAQFVDASLGDFRLAPGSPAIDTGDPAAPVDPDGSVTDRGCFTFVPPAPVLLNPRGTGSVSVPFAFSLQAFPHRNYVLESSTNLTGWSAWRTLFVTNEITEIIPPLPGQGPARFHRARLAP